MISLGTFTFVPLFKSDLLDYRASASGSCDATLSIAIRERNGCYISLVCFFSLFAVFDNTSEQYSNCMSLALHSRPMHVSLSPEKSPFPLDFQQLTGFCRLSSTTYSAAWLRVPVRVTYCMSREQIAEAIALADLRHPNIEFLLGITVPPDFATVAAVTQAVGDKDIATMISDEPKASLSPPLALRIALDVARGLMYLYERTGNAHGCVTARNVWYDSVRNRAVLGMLERRYCSKATFQTDVQDFLVLLGKMLGGNLEFLRASSPVLANLVSRVYLKEELCDQIRLPSMNDIAEMLRRAQGEI